VAGDPGTDVFSRVKIDREIEAELHTHIEMRTEDNVTAGMTPEQARREALIRFGSPSPHFSQALNFVAWVGAAGCKWA